MKDCVRELCILAIFCGAVLSLCPECGAEKILRLLESVLMLAVILNGMNKLDLSAYSIEIARYHESEKEILNCSEDMKNRLDRFVIEEEYRTYVEKRAEAMGIYPTEILIQTRWSKEGFWVPDSSRIRLQKKTRTEELSAVLFGELGISVDRQEWITDE